MILVLVSPRQRGLDLSGVDDCVVITGGPVPSGASELVTVADYRTETLVAAGLELARRHRFERVVSFAEADVVAAAQLREALDLPGQRPVSALAYRDKALMRKHSLAAGLPGPAYRTVETAAEVREFVADQGLPAVLKPRSSSGSVGVRILRSTADLAELPDQLADHVVEQFVPGEVVHVDGLLVGGKPVFALPAAYTDLACLAHWEDSGSGSLLLTAEHPWHGPLTEELWRVVAALPAAEDLVLHAEFFVAEGQRPVLCEIASRLPGHPIPPMINRALGLDLRATWLRIAAGLPVDVTAIAGAAVRAGSVANFGLPPRHGRITSVPTDVPPWVHDLEVLAKPGDVWDRDRYEARKSGDFVVTWTVTADSEGELRQRIQESADLMEGKVGWQEIISVGGAR
ncbi:ATP-grasp domain-containing protein [Kutzneria sp. CA-103260]|uniref:ATP-grasp domain-containing protein n=1 Tax=Kutzneria sp. CA-103260 TaxID=2802641 RepID=UPI001BAC6FFC|nr:ATP-grasp domain-containing protein [Kutzneria sp. CA-103260]QUQ63441.1 L-arginine-specific L-amino acid ligase [Kutzneria sp. CA-103260]